MAGAEAALVLARRGFKVKLYEMKPIKFSPAHKYGGFAELVCSNSLKAMRVNSAAGMLKEEMRILGSIVIEAAEKTAVAAGGALAVDRKNFSDYITEKIKNNPYIEVISEECTALPEKNAVICTGPLTDGGFAESIAEVCGTPLSFYDAAAPIVSFESIDMDKAFYAARYGKGGADYINCPLNETEYDAFYGALFSAETALLHDFDNSGDYKVYEGCMPVEVLAKRGKDSLRYGCMKPVGLTDPKTERRPYAVVQLRKENAAGSLYNLVGFQTNLKFPEQKRVFGLIPALEKAEFMRYGVMHRNTFLNSPKLLDRHFMLKGSDNIFFGGQITGVEGYTESAASGIIAGIALADKLEGKQPAILPNISMIGALADYISSSENNGANSRDFQPMGANMGLLPPLDVKIKDKQARYEALALRGIEELKQLISN